MTAFRALKVGGLAATLVLAIATARPADASLAGGFVAGPNTIQDVSGELYMPGPNNTGDGTVQAGDIFVSFFSIQTNTTNGASYGNGGLDQLLGVFAVQVASVLTPNGTIDVGLSTYTASKLTFEAVQGTTLSGAVNTVCTTLGLGCSLSAIPGEVAGKTFAALFDAPPGTLPNSFRTQSVATTAADINSVNNLAGLAFLAELDPANAGEKLTANAPNMVSDLLPSSPNQPSGTNAGNFGGIVNLTYEHVPGYTFDPGVTVSGQIFVPQTCTAPAGLPLCGFPVNDGLTLSLTAHVPEPTSVAVFGAGLLALGAFGFRARKRPTKA